MTPTKKPGWLKWLLIVLVLGGLAAGGYFYARRPKEAPADFKTAAVVRGDLTQAVTANGQITPVKNVQVGSQISGIINDIKVDFNARVKEGDIIAQIDPATYQQGVTQAEADLLSAKAAQELAELNNRRAQELLQSSLIPPSDADKTIADLHQAQAVVKMREASLKKAEVDLSRTTIYAPISGVVISRNVDVGQTVAASFSTPTLFLIANDLAKMEIDAMVSEADVGGVEEGQRVTFTVDAFPNRQFQGGVRQVRYAPTTNQNVVTYTTVVEVNNADLKLRPGMTANASIFTAQRPNALKIPNAALRFRPPDSALVKSATNTPPARPASASRGSTSNSLAAASDSESGSTPNREEMRRRFESMSPEERAAFRERMRARSGEGGGSTRNKPEGPATRTIYVLAKTNSPAGTEAQLAKPVTIKTGITDGSFTEVLDGLSEGDLVITGLNAGAAGGARPPGASNPFNNPFGGGMRPR